VRSRTSLKRRPRVSRSADQRSAPMRWGTMAQTSGQRNERCNDRMRPSVVRLLPTRFDSRLPDVCERGDASTKTLERGRFNRDIRERGRFNEEEAGALRKGDLTLPIPALRKSDDPKLLAEHADRTPSA